MKVSVIIPVYKVEAYIGQCARSLFNQTYGDLEYIFVDDCSPDNSIPVVEETLSDFPERRSQVHIIRHDRNRGSGAARLTAMQHATGDFLTFVDGDDFLPDDGIGLLVKRQLETGADMVDGATDVFADGRLQQLSLPYRGRNYTQRLIVQNVVPHQLWGRLIRRSLFTDHDISFTEGINQGEDYGIMPRVAYYARRSTTDSLVYHYRMDRQGSFTDGLSPRHIDSFLRANRQVADFFRAKERCYQYPLSVGLINTAYRAVTAGRDMNDVKQQLGGWPHGLLFALAAWLLSQPRTLNLARLEYLILKRIYITMH